MDWTDYQYAGDGKMTEGELNNALQRREQEIAQFQQYQRGPSQIAESIKQPTELGREFHKEGFWANPNLPATHHLPFPKEGKNWAGKDQFLAYMRSVQNHLRRDIIIYRQPEKCLICGTEKIGQGDFVDRNNKVIWKEGFEHYVEKHHIVPTEFFFKYIQMAGQVVGQKAATNPILHVPPPRKQEQVSAAAPPPSHNPMNGPSPLERIQKGTYFSPHPQQQQQAAASPSPPPLQQQQPSLQIPEYMKPQ